MKDNLLTLDSTMTELFDFALRTREENIWIAGMQTTFIYTRPDEENIIIQCLIWNLTEKNDYNLNLHYVHDLHNKISGPYIQAQLDHKKISGRQKTVIEKARYDKITIGQLVTGARIYINHEE